MGRPRSLIPPCRFCEKKFKRREHLRRHERTHTHEKPFACDCGEKFARQDMLARHVRLSHPESIGASDVVINETSSMVDLHRDAGRLTPSDPTCHGGGEPRSTRATAETSYFLSSPTARDHCVPDIQNNGTVTSGQADFIGLASEGPVDQTFQWNETDDLEFLWNNTAPFSEVLPASFFDTNLSLADLSQQYSQISRLEQQHVGDQRAGQNEQHIPAPLRDTTRHPSPGLERSDFPHSGNPFQEQTRGGEDIYTTASNETDPSGNHRLEGNANPPICPWKVSPSDYETISREMKDFCPVLPPSFSLPSRHTLSRFLEGYFRGFHEHMPFLHAPSCTALTLGPELILSLAAVGALYRFEHAKGYKLYQAARTLINWRLGHRNQLAISKLTETSPGYAGLPNMQGQLQSTSISQGNEEIRVGSDEGPNKLSLRLLQGLLVLMALTMWGDHAVAPDSLAMTGQVAMLVREIGISAPDTSSEANCWETWIEREERRRTLFVAYILFNLQCVAFNVPPMIMNQEVSLNLPACGEVWRASTAQEWTRLRELYTPLPRSFQQTLGQLLQGDRIHKPDAVSAFSNYVLIHGLVQEIFLARNTRSLVEYVGSLRTAFVQAMESALRSWQESWEATYESTLDPLSPKGPMGFNATALVRLAYIRLNANAGPNRQLSTRDPVHIAHGFSDGQTAVYDRSPHLDRAVLQCIHALSVPVRLGIPFIARTQTLNWSIQHSLCNLECAFLLNHWLQTISECVEASGIQTLRDDERKLLNMIHSIVGEADLLESSDWVDGDAQAIRRLAVSSVRLWAETFKGFHVFEISHVVGESLAIVVDILDAQLAAPT